MATKAQLQEQVDTLLETVAQLQRELDMTNKLAENSLVEDDTLPWEDQPVIYTRKPSVSSFKARCAAARAEAMASGRVVKI